MKMVDDKKRILISGTFSIELTKDELVEFLEFLNKRKVHVVLNNRNIMQVDDKYDDLTLKDAINMYFKEKNLKKWTIRNYISSFRAVFSKLCENGMDNWRSLKVKSIDYEFISRFRIQSSTDYQYCYSVNIVFSWMERMEIISNNPFSKYLSQITRFKHTVRPALNCDEWIDRHQAKEEISYFFSRIRGMIKPELYYFLVLHFILATRITETLNYIDAVKTQYRKKPEITDGVYIKTKCTRQGDAADFRIPVPSFIYEMVLNCSVLFMRYRPGTVLALFRKTLVKNFKNEFCLHGTRAIFRTTIDFLTEGGNFTDDAKECYINHKVDSYVKSRYHRNDYFMERIRMMCIYAGFIYECAGFTKEIKKLRSFESDFFKRENKV